MFVCVCVCVSTILIPSALQIQITGILRKINKMTWKKVILPATVQETLRVGKRDCKKCSRKQAKEAQPPRPFINAM